MRVEEDPTADPDPSSSAEVRPRGLSLPSSALSASRAASAGVDLQRLLRTYMLVLAIPALVVLFSALRPQTFFTLGNFQTILTTQAALLVLSLAVTVPLAAGEFDLSFFGIVGLSASLMAWLGDGRVTNLALALLISFAVALIVGAFNAIFVVGLGVGSTIATLGMGTLTVGLGLAITDSQTLPNYSESLASMMQGRLWGIGLPFYYSIALVVVLWVIFEHTAPGRHLFFTGEGPTAARLAGVRVDRIRAFSLIASAVGSWAAAVILLGQTGAAEASYGEPYIMLALAAVFLGATTVRLGRFNAVGTMVGVYLLAVGATGLQLMGVSTWVIEVFSGGVLVVAVALANVFGGKEQARA